MATPNDKVEKIYVIRGEGAPALLTDLDNIAKKFRDIRKEKQALDGQKTDPQEANRLAEINKRLAELEQREKEYQAALSARLAEAQEAISTNNRLTGTYEQLADALEGATAAGGVSTDPAAVQAQAAATDALAEAQEQLTAGADQAAAATEAQTTATAGLGAAQDAAAEAAEEAAGATRDNSQAQNQEQTIVQRLSQTLFQLQARRQENSKALRDNTTAYNQGLISFERYIETGTKLTQEQADLNRAVTDTRRALTQQIVATQSTETSMTQLGVVLGILRAQYRDLSAAQRETAEGRELLNNIQEMDQEIKRLDKTIGNHQREVGNYKLAYDGLGASVQQILREAPSAANSINTFFLAISNNLPQFFDEFRRASDALQELNAAAKEAQAAQASSAAAQSAAARASQDAEAALGDQVESLIASTQASAEQAAAIKENIAATTAEAGASVEAAEAAGIHTEQMALNAGASVEDAAALRQQVIATGQATLAANEATVALERQTLATVEATAAQRAAPGPISRIASSLFSVNTALTLGVLALTLYGKDLINFFQYLGKTDDEIEAIKYAAEKLKKEEEAIKQARRDALEELEKLQKDLNKAMADGVGTADALFAAVSDVTRSDKDRQAALKELQRLYPEYFKNMTTEKTLAGDIAAEYLHLRDALVAKAASQVYQDKYNESLRKEFDFQEKITELQKQQAALPNQSTLTSNSQGMMTYTQGDQASDTKAVSLNQQIRDLQAEQTEESYKRARYLKEIEDRTAAELQLRVKAKKEPAIVDNAKQEAEAAKKLNDANAELARQRLEIEIQNNQAIFENDQETLQARLAAYEKYKDLRLQQAQKTRDAEIKNAQADIDAAQKQLKDGKKRDQEATNALLDTISAGNVRKIIAAEAYAAKEAEIERKRASDVKGIVESDIQVRLQALDDIKEAAARNEAAQLKILQESRRAGTISYKQYQTEKKRLAAEAHLYELNLLKTYLEEQIKGVEATGQSAQTLKKELAKVNKDIADAQGAGFDVDAKRIFDLQQFYKDLKNTAADAAKTIADGFIQNQQRQIDKDLELRQQALDTEKAKRSAQAQSVAEQEALDREYDQKKQGLEREAFERRKKLAIKQLAIEFAVASIKAISAGFETGGIYGALAAEALVALEYAAKYAAVQSQQFAKGGEVPSDGGEFGGRPHSQGGTKFQFRGGQFEAEAKELAIINKRSAQSNEQLTVSGTVKQIASALNRYGGGVEFAPGARLNRFEYGGSLGATLPAPYLPPSYGVDASGSAEFMRIALRAVEATNSRIDRLQVVVDPTAVQRSNDDRQKIADLGRL